MLFMVIERFRNGDPGPVYRRAREKGRMEGADPALVAQWTARWEDLVDFEVVPVVTSAEAFARYGQP
jgi:hypothetical protein